MRFLRFCLLVGVLIGCGTGLHAQTIVPYAHNNTVTPPNSQWINDLSLTGGSASTVNWPTGAAYVNINCASPPYWTSNQSGITVPNSNVTNGTGAALNAAQRQRGPGETAFYIISASSQVCSFEFWGS
jgi:hypothetical protein